MWFYNRIGKTQYRATLPDIYIIYFSVPHKYTLHFHSRLNHFVCFLNAWHTLSSTTNQNTYIHRVSSTPSSGKNSRLLYYNSYRTGFNWKSGGRFQIRKKNYLYQISLKFIWYITWDYFTFCTYAYVNDSSQSYIEPYRFCFYSVGLTIYCSYCDHTINFQIAANSK